MTKDGKFIPVKEDIKKIVMDIHIEASHLGRDKTVAIVAQRYYWKGLNKDVREILSKCERCQKVNAPIKLLKPPCQPIKVIAPWYHIQIDCVGPMDTISAKGNLYMIVVIDVFSGFPFVRASPTKAAVEVAQFLLDLSRDYGFWKVIQSDQGKEFVNETMRAFNEMFDIRHQVASAYHPQSQGKVEKFNGTLQSMLKKVNTVGDQWDEHIANVVYSYRTCVHASSK